MDFTREPIIETVITPREGCKLVVRSSKSAGQEEYFVDALEVVSFGNSFFFRSLERPKSFLVPTSDFEVLEVREARMVLKNTSSERTIKIAGGRETPRKEVEPPAKESEADKKSDKKRDRKRQQRKRRGRGKDEAQTDLTDEGLNETSDSLVSESTSPVKQQVSGSIVSSLLPPPPTLISESIQRYKSQELFLEEAEDLVISDEEGDEAQKSDEDTLSDEESDVENPYVVEVEPSPEGAIINSKEETTEES